MRSIGVAMLALALLQGSPVRSDNAQAEVAIRAIVAAQVQAWNAGDGRAYARDVAPDASFTNIFGMVMYGHDAFEKRHAEILASFYKGTTKSQAVKRLRFVTPDVAVVDIDNEVRGVRTLPSGLAVPADGIVRTQLMQVFVRRDGRWLVEAYHNVDVKPPQ
jgi:uncharacterized protein (TIGR02246 family)